ncbi:MAG TPA: hypothetical protein VOB72_06570, partial [Candidatus Dormibacteraeota bacterium]|nr:hypothetical protein [Candidatus Dormibacteraeota bacterium]
MSTLIRHLGADVDAEALEREIRAEVARKEREGVYGPELLLGIAPDALRDRMEALRGAAELTLDPPVHSTRPGLGPMVAAVKRAVAKLLRWHTRWLVGQVQTLGGSTVAALSEMADRVDEVERRQERVLEQLTRMQAAYLVAHPSYPDATWAAALADVAMLQDLAVRPERGAVACL